MKFWQSREFWKQTLEVYTMGFIVPFASLLLTGTLWLVLPAWLYVLYRDQKEVRYIIHSIINQVRK